ncbi:MAG TPA: aminoacyl-tRNA hydrolase [Candidatus Paceibacterota bacterium]|nr:aminoacyl-tRNA hydrolase [Candidatus Paceibacterota bacterium]
MQWVVAGLGNPDEEYVGTRHNIGRDFLRDIEKKEGEKGLPAGRQGSLFGVKATLITPDVYMNNSGGPLKKMVPSKAAAQRLIVVHDELDLPLGRVKISFGSSAGGHNGVKSVIKALKTQDFVRVRVGISPTTPSGKLKRPDAEKIVDFVLGKFKPAEQEKLKKAKKVVSEALEIILKEGVDAAMMQIHSK